MKRQHENTSVGIEQLMETLLKKQEELSTQLEESNLSAQSCYDNLGAISELHGQLFKQAIKLCDKVEHHRKGLVGIHKYLNELSRLITPHRQNQSLKESIIPTLNQCIKRFNILTENANANLLILNRHIYIEVMKAIKGLATLLPCEDAAINKYIDSYSSRMELEGLEIEEPKHLQHEETLADIQQLDVSSTMTLNELNSQLQQAAEVDEEIKITLLELSSLSAQLFKKVVLLLKKAEDNNDILMSLRGLVLQIQEQNDNKVLKEAIIPINDQIELLNELSKEAKELLAPLLFHIETEVGKFNDHQSLLPDSDAAINKYIEEYNALPFDKTAINPYIPTNNPLSAHNTQIDLEDDEDGYVSSPTRSDGERQEDIFEMEMSDVEEVDTTKKNPNSLRFFSSLNISSSNPSSYISPKPS